MPGARRGAAGLLALAALAAAGCGGGRRDEGTVLHFVSWKPNQPEVWAEVLHRFEEANPDLRVERQIGPHSSTAFHDLLTQKLKNRDPDVDVFFMDVIWPAEFAAAGWALDLSQRFPEPERSRFLPGPIEANTWRGRIYGVPVFIDAGILYYRKDLLAKHGFAPPATWDELAARAQRIVAAERAEGTELIGYSGQFKQYEGLVCNMLEIVASNGGRLVDPAVNAASLSDPATVEAVRWTRHNLIGSVAPRAVLTFEEPESLAPFLQGHAVFLRSWPYAWEVVNNPGRSRVAGKVGIAPLPHFDGHSSAATLGGWQYGISAFSRHPEEAWRFIAYMTSPETQKFLALRASLAPTRKALYDDPDVLAANPHFAAQAAAFRAAIPRPVTPVYPAVSQVLQRFFSEALARTGSDVPRLARAADEQIDAYLEMIPSPR